MNIIDKTLYDGFEPLPLDVAGWHGDDNYFGDVIETIRPRTIVEIGSWKGQSTINMAQKVKELGLDCTIYCIDTWLGSAEFWIEMSDTPTRDLRLKNGYPQIYYQFLSNIVRSRVKDYVLPLPMPSSIGLKYLLQKGIKADLIYVDASHEEDDVIADIEGSMKIISPDGMIFGDDYFSWQGVRRAVDAFVERNKHNHKMVFATTNNIFWSIKLNL